jgi:uroporphyrinogen decarboxylase
MGGDMMTLSPRDLVIAQIEHRETGHIPYTLSWEGDVAERLDAYYGSAAWQDLIDNAIQHVRGPSADLYVDETIRPLATDIYGTTWRTDRRPTHLVEPALKTPSLEGFRFPDIGTLFAPGWQEASLREIEEKQGHFTVTGFSFGLFERTWTLRGFNEALMDAVAEPDFYEELVRQIAEHQLAIVERLLELPVDGIMFSDDWGYQQGVLLGPARWRRILKPWLAKMYDRVHKAGKYALSHCCGSIVDIIPDVIEIGLDVLESVQPEAAGMNPYDLKRRFGDRLAFWGALGSQSTIAFGTPAEIQAEVTRLCREMGRGGGYILAPAKALQPETSTENAAAVVEAFLQQSGVAFP